MYGINKGERTNCEGEKCVRKALLDSLLQDCDTAVYIMVMNGHVYLSVFTCPSCLEDIPLVRCSKTTRSDALLGKAVTAYILVSII